MKRIYYFVKNTWWLFLLLLLAPLIVIAIFAIMEYSLKQIDMSAGDWAGLLGAAFSYWGTVLLGILAFWQNNQVQENNDILINYEKNKMSPIFGLTLVDYQGMFQNMKFELLNCSDNIAANVKVLELEIYKVDTLGSNSLVSINPIMKSDKIDIIEAHSKIKLEFQNKAIEKKKNENFYFIVTIIASDIIGLRKITTVTIHIDDSLKCKYNYTIVDYHE